MFAQTLVDEAMARRARRLLSLSRSADAPSEQPVSPVRELRAPYYDELELGRVFQSAGVTITVRVVFNIARPDSEPSRM